MPDLTRLRFRGLGQLGGTGAGHGSEWDHLVLGGPAPRLGRVAVERIHIAPALATSTLQEIAGLAEAIAIVEVSGPSEALRNSDDGRRWGEPGKTSFVYRDTPVSVIRLIRGDAPASFSLRLLGGAADGVEMDFEAGGPDLAPGDRYLVFLEQLDFPTESGIDESWTAVRLGQGRYHRTNEGWFDDIQQLSVRDSDIPALGQ